MKRFSFLIYFLAFLMAGAVTGCGSSSEPAGHKHGAEEHEAEEREAHKHEPGEEHEHEAEDEHESPSGASFKPEKGITLTDETRDILGVEIAEVVSEKLPQVIHFNVQIFGETHRFPHVDLDHTGCDVHGSGFLLPEKAAPLEPNQPVEFKTATNDVFKGFIVEVKKNLAHGESEIVVGVMDAGTKLKDGEFITATANLSREEAVTTIPKEALLRTSEGTFVYAVKDSSYHRTAVKLGGESDDKIEIVDGLVPGDKVVTKPVETLWLIELRATKGGGHSH